MCFRNLFLFKQYVRLNHDVSFRRCLVHCPRRPRQLHLRHRCCVPTRAMAASCLKLRDSTLLHTTVDRAPLDKRSARRRELYLTTLTTNKHTCPLRGLNPQSQQASGRRPTPGTGLGTTYLKRISLFTNLVDE